jgi:DtxR family Mn-dependent transcriptional regulator
MVLEIVKVSPKMEAYIEAIYRLQKKTGLARTSDLAEDLSVALGTITNTIGSLEKKGFVVRKPYRGVRLTERGRRIALDVIRRHRLSERFMTDVLKVDWSHVYKPAGKFARYLPDEIVKPLEKVLGHPQTCPHGNPIPTKCGGIIEEESEPLTELNLNERGILVKISEEKPRVLRHLAEMGLVPRVLVKVERRDSSKGLITLEVQGIKHNLPKEIASIIWVKKC